MTTQRGGIPGPSSSRSPGGESPTASQASHPGSSGAAGDKPELPWAFIDCPTDTLVILIAHMLELLCQHNDQVLLTPDALTRFHSRASPGITIVDYLRRIVKYTNLEKIPLLSLLAYIDLTCQNLPSFTLSSLTVHRFLIAGVTAGSKAQCDVFCTNAHYAKVGGIKVGELNSLEREFLRVTGWALCCNSDLLQRYYTSLIRSHGGYVHAPEPEVSPFMAFPDAGKAPHSEPATPADSAKDEGESELGSVDEMDEEDRGRPRHREDTEGMDVDLPTAPGRVSTRTSVSAAAASPDIRMATDQPKRGNSDGDRVRTQPQQAEKTERVADRQSGLKTFVGGLFGRRDRSQDAGGGGNGAANPANANTGSGVGHTNAGQAHDRSSNEHTPDSKNGHGHTINRSRPVASPALAASTAQNHADPPKQLTPRVRTRDERSVESLRGVGMPPPVAVDDCKRRARGD